MSTYEQLVEQHHKRTYADGVRMVAQQMNNPLKQAVTVKTGLTGEAVSVADLLNKKEYTKAAKNDTKNPNNRSGRSRRWLVFPEKIHDGELILSADMFQMSQNPTSDLVRNSVAAVTRGEFDTILGVERNGDGTFRIGSTGIFGLAKEGKDPETATALPSKYTLKASLGGSSTAAVGLNLEKLITARQDVRLADFGLDGQQVFCCISPYQEADLLRLAAEAKESLNAFQIQQLQSGVPTGLMGVSWIMTNRLPTDAAGNQLCPMWTKGNVVAGYWQEVHGQMWNDTSQQNLPYIYTSVLVDASRVEDEGVRVIPCKPTKG